MGLYPTTTPNNRSAHRRPHRPSSHGLPPLGAARPWALVALLAAGSLVGPSFAEAQELSPEKATALAAVEALADGIRDLSMTLWDYSELALMEDASAEYLAAFLEAEGFTVERGVAEMPTAFVASFGSGRPIVGILAEYDALPNIGNAVVPRKEPRSDGFPHGQGCGHNLFGAGSVAAAVAIKRTMEEHGIQGTVRLYGSPAEETVVGKVYMAKAGLFDDLDASLDWHPGLETKVSNQSGQAMNNFEVEFFGQAAHSAADPWNGRSALDAVEMMNFGANLMREHIRPTARIHYVIPSAGEAPNVVPEYARVWYYVRDTARAPVDANYQRLLDIAQGAALGTRTEYSVTLLTGVHSVLLNRPLQEAMQANLETVGSPKFSEEDQTFARQLQEFLEIEQKGLDGEVKPLKPEPEPPGGGSTDVAEVSWIAPAASLSVTTAAAGIPWHSWAASASHGTEGSVRGAEVAAAVLALTAVDVLLNPELVQEARSFWEEKTDGQPYVSPVPADQKPPLPRRGG
ncbi:amidohydrolase [Gemmatimonadota bacterium]